MEKELGISKEETETEVLKKANEEEAIEDELLEIEEEIEEQEEKESQENELTSGEEIEEEEREEPQSLRKKSIHLMPRPFDIESGSFMSFIQGEGPIDITPSAGKYIWNVNLPGWIFRSLKERGVKHVDETTLLKKVANLCCDPKFKVSFADKLAYNTIQRYEDDFRVKATSSAPIRMQDVKDVVFYTVLIDIPKLFIRFFYTVSVDKFLRSLIIYMQYLLQVCRAMKRRNEESVTKLWHPNTIIKYDEWRTNLDMFRFILGRNYHALLTGRPRDIWPFKHNKHPGVPDYKRDKMLFELLYVFSRRVVEISLYEIGNKIIEEEINRLFRPEGYRKIQYLQEMEPEQRAVIESKIINVQALCKAPAVRELGRICRKLPFTADTDLFISLGDEPISTVDIKSNVVRILQLLYLLPEKRFGLANIRLGILGFKRENFNPTLTDQTNQVKFDEAQIPQETDLSFSDDPASRYPEPCYLVPKMVRQQPFCINYSAKPLTAQDDRCAFWLKNAKLSNRVISDYIMSMS